MAARSAEHVHFLKRPTPFAFCFAASRLPPAMDAFDFHWPLARLPPTYFTFFAFFFLAFGFLDAFFAGFFLAAVFFCAVRASSDFLMKRFTTVVSVATSGSSSNTIGPECAVAIALEP